jgi:hypothetical protein
MQEPDTQTQGGRPGGISDASWLNIGEGRLI